MAVSQAMLEAPRYELIPIRGMHEEAARLPAGAVITVTCSPKHGIERTLEAAIELSKQGFIAIPHIAARLVRDEPHLHEILRTLSQHSLHEIFVVGGDAPSPAGVFDGAVPLLEVIAASSLRPLRIGIPGYPEGHASISDAALEAALIAKRPYADYLVTQLCFDPIRIIAWLREIHQKGIGLPAWIGLPGVMDPRRLLGISLKIGIGSSLRVLRRNQGMTRQLWQGAYAPDHLINPLLEVLADGATPPICGFHLNTFNHLEPLLAWQADRLTEFA